MAYGYFNVSKNVKIAFSCEFNWVLLIIFLPAIFIMANEMMSLNWLSVMDLRPPLPKFKRLKNDRLDWINSITLAVFSAVCRRFCSLFEGSPLTVDGVRLPGERVRRLGPGVRRLVAEVERRRAPYVWRRSPNSDKFVCEPLRWRCCRFKSDENTVWRADLQR